jgi:tetratricopeptide (TPR) repeat protein
VREFEFCLEHSLFLRSRLDEGNAWFSLGAAYGFLGDYEKAMGALTRSLKALSKSPIELSMSYYVLGAYQMEQGNHVAAGRSFKRSLAAAASVNYTSGIEKARSGQALVCAIGGDLRRARELFDQSLGNLEGGRFIHPLVFQYGAKIACLEGNFDLAIESLHRGSLFAQHFRAEMAFVHWELARVFRKKGDSDLARENLARAENLFTEMEAPLQAARVREEMSPNVS